MSVEAMSEVFGSALEPTLRLVMLTLANYANKEGCSIYPSVSTIAINTGLSERTIQNSIKLLISKKILEWTGKTDRGCNIYRISFEWLRLYLPEPAAQQENTPPYMGVQELRGGAAAAPLNHDLDAPDSPQGGTRFTLGGQEIHPRGAAAAPDPLINHQFNHQLTTSGEISENSNSKPREAIPEPDPNPFPPKDWRSSPEKLWNVVLTQLEPDLPRTNFLTWVKGSTALSYSEDGTCLIVECNRPDKTLWMRVHLAQTINRILAGSSDGKINQVKFISSGEELPK